MKKILMRTLREGLRRARPAVRSVEIEISRACNWRCEYCPMAETRRHQETMPPELFREIIDKSVRHRRVRYVTFNSYNEPTLDPHFDERMDYLSTTRLKLKLHTNGSRLTAERMERLRQTGLLEGLVFNLPSLDGDRFRRVTGARDLGSLLDKIDRAISLRLPVEVVLLGTAEERARELPALRGRFGARLRESETTDRAGSLKNRYADGVRVEGALYGCPMVLEWLHVGIDGGCFICCEDFHQRVIYANIRDGEIAEILSGEGARRVRRQVYGVETAPPDFICRSCIEMARRAPRASATSVAENRESSI
jgi:hypothetical protein